MGEIQPKTCDGRELTKNQLAALVAALEAPSPKSDRPLFRKEKICHAIGNAAGPATLVEAMRALSHAAEAACKTYHLLKKCLPAPSLVRAAGVCV